MTAGHVTVCRREMRFELSSRWVVCVCPQFDQFGDVVHLLQPGFDASLCESLFGGEAADVVIEKEFGCQSNSLDPIVARSIPDRDVQRSRVVVRAHFHVLQQSHEFGYTETQLSIIRLDQDQLPTIDHHESPHLRPVFCHHGAGNQVTVICVYHVPSQMPNKRIQLANVSVAQIKWREKMRETHTRIQKKAKDGARRRKNTGNREREERGFPIASLGLPLEIEIARSHSGMDKMR